MFTIRIIGEATKNCGNLAYTPEKGDFVAACRITPASQKSIGTGLMVRATRIAPATAAWLIAKVISKPTAVLYRPVHPLAMKDAKRAAPMLEQPRHLDDGRYPGRGLLALAELGRAQTARRDGHSHRAKGQMN